MSNKLLIAFILFSKMTISFGADFDYNALPEHIKQNIIEFLGTNDKKSHRLINKNLSNIVDTNFFRISPPIKGCFLLPAHQYLYYLFTGNTTANHNYDKNYYYNSLEKRIYDFLLPNFIIREANNGKFGQLPYPSLDQYEDCNILLMNSDLIMNKQELSAFYQYTLNRELEQNFNNRFRDKLEDKALIIYMDDENIKKLKLEEKLQELMDDGYLPEFNKNQIYYIEKGSQASLTKSFNKILNKIENEVKVKVYPLENTNSTYNCDIQKNGKNQKSTSKWKNKFLNLRNKKNNKKSKKMKK